MTTPEFLRLLTSAREQFDWVLTPDTSHFSERRKTARLRLEATHAQAPDTAMNPVQAVAFLRCGRFLASSTDAGDVLGMDPHEVSDVVAAAHDRTWEGRPGEREPVSYLVAIRRELLQAVGMMTHLMS